MAAKNDRKQTRAQKSEQMRASLFRAAASVVGKQGYADASVAKITAQAKVAQGTFYNYFASRQKLFDVLLPEIGQGLLDYTAKKIPKDMVGIEREVARLNAYFEYVAENPGFYRILNEAEFFAPKAYKKHFAIISAGYVNALHRSKERGELIDLSDEEIEVVAFILMSARNYFSFRYGYRGTRTVKVPQHVISAYTKLLHNGLFAH